MPRKPKPTKPKPPPTPAAKPAPGASASNHRPPGKPDPKGPPPPEPAALKALRQKTDVIGPKLVALLIQRAAHVVDAGKVKRSTGVPVYAPHREAQVLAKVLGHNKGPLPDRTIEGVYRELMSGSFRLELPLR